MGEVKKVKVDSNKLRAELKRRGIKISEAGQALGYSRQYLQNTIARGDISVAGSILLEQVLNIKYDAIKPDEPIEEAQAEAPAVSVDPIDYDRLYDTVFRAVYDAYTKAWAAL